MTARQFINDITANGGSVQGLGTNTVTQAAGGEPCAWVDFRDAEGTLDRVYFHAPEDIAAIEDMAAPRRAVRNINEAYGGPEVFDSLADMEKAVHELDELNPGEGYWPSDGLQEGRDYEVVVMLMNPATGSVAPKEEWESDFRTMSEEEWGGPEFEDGHLVEVEPDGTGWWREVKA